MDGFEVFVIKPRRVLAAFYKKDGSNRGALTGHSLISEVANSLVLNLITPEGDVRVEPGEWIVKQDGDFYKFTDVEFHNMFEEVTAGVKCIFCGEKSPNIDKLKEHSAVCVAHPANKSAPTA